MQKIAIIIVGVFSCFLLQGQTKRALIVAIGDYAPASKIPPIASVNDVKYIKAALFKNKFEEKNIDTLINAAATKNAILLAFDKLIASSQTGDIIMIHFSCHGQQIRDQKTAELGMDEDDGYDESFLAYDAFAKYSHTGYKGENHLRDDELDVKLTALRKKIGNAGSVLILLDACHSGTGTRDESFAASRGEPIPFPDPENPLKNIVTLDIQNETQGSFLDDTSANVSNMVVFSASSPHQVNKQILNGAEEVGSLSYSFYKAMNEVPANSSYDFLFKKIKAAIQGYIPTQIPMMEGNGDQVIFSGAFTGSSAELYAHVGMPGIVAEKDSLFTIEAGSMDNLKAGMNCEVFLAGSDALFAKGIIKKVENFRSIIIADKLLDAKTLYTVVIKDADFGNMQATIQTSVDNKDLAASKTAQQVRNFLAPSGIFSFTEKGDYQLAVTKVNARQNIQLTNRNNKTIWQTTLGLKDTISQANKNALLKSLKQEMKVNYLRALPDGGLLAPTFKVSLKNAADSAVESGLVLRAGDRYSLVLENNSEENLYYTVLDLYPDNTIEILYPYNGREPGDYLVAKNSVVVRKLAVSKNSPLGVETLKVIISKEPMDLRGVFSNKITRANSSSFEKMMIDVLAIDEKSMQTRGDVSLVKPEEIGILSTNMIIK